MPPNFDIWLNCCKNNNSFDWIIFTDDRTEYNYPSNVHVKYMTFSDMKKRLTSFFGYKVSLEKPYKLCDYRPMYGDIFKDELKQYDSWGWCDLDLFFGNLNKYYTEERLKKYGKINVLGHMSLLQNKEVIVSCYKNCDFRSIITDSRNWSFDEVRFEKNINNLIRQAGYPILQTVEYADLSYEHFSFHIRKYEGGKRTKFIPYYPSVFKYKDGCAFVVSLINNQIVEREVAYVHFQKRKIDIETSNNDEFLFVPNKIISYSDLTENELNGYSKDSLSYFLSKRKHRIKQSVIRKLPRFIFKDK